jgi:hypothetical protein
MARKVDALADEQTLTVLEQLQTKTVGPPAASTGLIGDQTPSNIISVADLDLVKNQIFTEVNNLEALNALNTIARIANLQGFGCIVDSGVTDRTSIAGSGASNITTLRQPNKGEVIQIIGLDANWNTSPGTSITFGFYVEDMLTNDRVIVGTVSSSSTNPALDANPFLEVPTEITYPMAFRATVSSFGSASSVTIGCYSVRTR